MLNKGVLMVGALFATFLNLPTRVDRLVGWNEGRICCAVAMRDGGMQLRMESILMAGVCLVWGRVGRYTLHERLVGLCTKTSTLPEGRSLNQRRAAF